LAEPIRPVDKSLLDRAVDAYQSGSKPASWLFGFGLLAFLMYVFFAVSNPTPSQCGLLRFFIALTAGLFFLFFVGGLVLQGQLRGLGVGAGGGVALFFLVQFVINPIPGCAIALPVSHPFKHDFIFGQSAFNVSRDNEGWYQGASPLGKTEEFNGRQVKIDKLTVTLDIGNKEHQLDCDAWVYVGSAPFGFSGNGGSVVNGGYPIQNEPSAARNAPVIAKFVIGSSEISEFPPGHQTVWATYDYLKQQPAGYPQIDRVKQSVSQPITVDNGLYGQVFVWTGNPANNLDVMGLKLQIEGTWVVTKTGT